MLMIDIKQNGHALPESMAKKLESLSPEMLLSTIPASVAYFDSKLILHWHNDLFRELCAEPLPTGRSFTEFFRQDVLGQIDPHIERILQGEKVQFDLDLFDLPVVRCYQVHIGPASSTLDGSEYFFPCH
jgi:hypothetical protein